MNLNIYFLGLPLITWLIVGGFFIFSVLAPAVTAKVMKFKEGAKDE